MIFPFRNPVSAIRNRIVVVRPDRLSEAAIDDAIGGMAETDPRYKAFMQLLDQAEEEAHDAADKDSYIPRALEIHTGGAKYIRAVRLNVLARRERFAMRKGPLGPRT